MSGRKTVEKDVHDAARVRCTLTDGWRGGFVLYVAGSEGNELREWNGIPYRDRPAWVAAQIADVVEKHGIDGWVVDKVTGWLCDVPLEHATSIKWRRKSVHTLCTETTYSYGDSRCCSRPVYEDGVELCGMHNKKAVKEAAIAEQQRLAQEEHSRRLEERQALKQVKDDFVHGRYAAVCEHLSIRASGMRLTYSQTEVTLTLDRFLSLIDAIIGPAIIEEVEEVAAEEAAPDLQAGVSSPFG